MATNANSPAKHTPGPWLLETVKTSIGICHKIGDFPHRPARANHACVYDDGSTLLNPHPELLANARLIAAAPELLEALEILLPEGWGDNDTMDHMSGVKLARTVIAKVKGVHPETRAESADKSIPEATHHGD